MMNEEIKTRIEHLECLVLKQEAIIKDQQQAHINLQQELAHKEAIWTDVRLRSDQANAMMAELQQLQQHQQQQYQPQHQQQQQQQRQTFGLGLSLNEVLNQLNQIQPFGKGQPLQQFINSVESYFNLCGNSNEIINYSIGIIRNSKIIGNPGRLIGLLPKEANWKDIKDQLRKEYGPRKSYADIFNYLRTIKVSNLRELFNTALESKLKINEIYTNDDDKSELYSPDNVDRDLTQILITKIDGQFRGCIVGQTTLTIESLQSIYSQLNLLDDKRTIDFRCRKNKKTETETKSNFSKNHNENRSTYTKSFRKKTFTKPQTDLSTNKSTPMDIDHLKEESDNEEVNFLKVSQNLNYP